MVFIHDLQREFSKRFTNIHAQSSSRLKCLHLLIMRFDGPVSEKKTFCLKMTDFNAIFGKTFLNFNAKSILSK